MPKIVEYNKLTRDQQFAVDNDGEVLVSAAAGSGKTTTLLAKIKRLIECGIPLSRMLILVYNESAATEIKQKLSAELFNCACEYTGEKAALYRKQLDEISFAHLGTIHSFCRSAIRENFEKLSIAPSFEVLDENSHKLYMQRALEDVFVEYTKSKDELFFKLCSVFESNRNEETIKKIIERIFEQFDVQPNPTEYADKLISSYSDVDDNMYKNVVIDTLKAQIGKIKCDLSEHKRFIELSENASYCTLADDIIYIADKCENADRDGFVKIMLDGFEFKKASAKKDDADFKDVFAIARKLRDELIKIMDKTRQLFADEDKLQQEFEQNKTFVEKLVEITTRFGSRLAELKKADGALSFSDLEHGVVNLINQGVDLSDDYDYVFVDEYQDVNPTQEFIISHLLKDNAFFVGDIKQSIYGFRLANPKIFLDRLDKREQAAQNGDGIAPISFVDNFRSENQILEFVNEIFDKVMTKDSADVDYLNDARFNKTDRMDGAVKMAVFFTPSKSNEEAEQGIFKIEEAKDCEQDRGKSELEGEYIAREIKSLVGKGVFGDRKLNYGDFAILFRSRSGSSARILAKLKEEGIPFDDGAFAKEDDDSESELITFLKVIDNPRQDFAFAGFLLSYFGGYDENELFEISRCKTKPVSKDAKENFYSAFIKKANDDDSLGAKCRRTLDKLNEYRVKASFKSVASLVNTIIADNDYDAYLRSKGDAVWNSVENFIASIDTSEKSISLSQFLAEYGENKKPAKKCAGGDCVQVSTFHSYKGLEVPVVFIANANEDKSPTGTNDFFILDNGMIGLSYFDDSNKMKNADTLSMTALKFKIQEKEYKEEMRLAYVALTRAQKMMYITGRSSCTGEKTTKSDVLAKLSEYKFNLGKSIFDFIFQAKEKGAKIGLPEVYFDEDLEKTKTKPAPVLSQTDSVMMRMIEDSWDYSYPYKDATVLPMKYSVSSLVSIGEEEVETVRVYDDKTNEGTIYHKFMENTDFDICDLSDVENRKNQLVKDGIMTREEADVIDGMKIIKALQTSELRMASTHDHECEKPFMMYVPANEVNPETSANDKVLVQGVIDLWIKGDKSKGEGDVIVDYKYSALKDETALKNYEKQLKLYKMAIQKAFSVKIDEICLVSLKTGEVKKFD